MAWGLRYGLRIQADRKVQACMATHDKKDRHEGLKGLSLIAQCLVREDLRERLEHVSWLSPKFWLRAFGFSLW